MKSKAHFSWEVDGQYLFIEDENRGGMSVTNDVENVLKEIQEEFTAGGFGNIDDKTIFYLDSDNTVDGLKTKNNEFVDFVHVQANSFEQAQLIHKPWK